jgi:hypothetical protein
MALILLFALDEAVRRPRRRVGCEERMALSTVRLSTEAQEHSALIHWWLITTGHVG